MAQSEKTEKITDIPDVVIKSGKMFPQLSLTAKVGAIILGLIVYTYFIFILKDFYYKTKKLDYLQEMMAKAEKMLDDVQSSDQIMQMRLNQHYLKL